MAQSMEWSETTHRIWAEIEEHGPVSARDLQNAMGLSRSATYRALKTLETAGRIQTTRSLQDVRLRLVAPVAP